MQGNLSFAGDWTRFVSIVVVKYKWPIMLREEERCDGRVGLGANYSI